MREPEETEVHTLAGGGADIAGPTRDVVVLEGRHDLDRPGGSELTLWLFSKQGAREIEPAEIAPAIAQDENLLWIDLSGYGSDRLNEVGASLGLQPGEIEAATTSWQRPRLQVYGERFFVSVTVARPERESYRVTAGELDLFVGHNYLVTAHRQELLFIERILARARMSPELIRLDSAYMLYIVLDEVLAYYEDVYEDVQTDIDLLEERALTDSSDRFLEDLVRFKRYITALNRLAEQHRQVFSAFLRPDFPLVAGNEVGPYYRDLEGRLARLLDTLASARDATTGAFDVYVSQMSHRTNQIIKILTIVSATMFPISVIVAVFGTSFKNLPIYTSAGFVVMIVLVASILIAATVFSRRSGWI